MKGVFQPGLFSREDDGIYLQSPFALLHFYSDFTIIPRTKSTFPDKFLIKYWTSSDENENLIILFHKPMVLPYL